MEEPALTTCPTCGRPVPESQRFCGNCGTDVQAASAYRAAQASPAGAQTPGGLPFLGFDQGGFDVAAVRRPSTLIIALIVAGVAIVCLCCGMVFGAAAMYWLGPVPSSEPVFQPTPESLNQLFNLLQV